MNPILLVVTVSLLVQLGAVYLALRLIRITGRTGAWLLIAGAIALMAVRRALALAEHVGASLPSGPSLPQEIVALAISALLAAGLYLIAPVFRRIEERKERLRESDARLRALMEKIPDGIGLMVEGRLEELNPALEEMLGYSREELLGSSPADHIYPDDRDRVQERLEEMERGGGRRPGRYRMIRKDGGVVWVEVFSRPIELDGRPALVGVFRDLTDRMRAQTDRQRLVTAVEQTTDAIMVTGPDGDIQWVNPAFEEISGYDRTELIGVNPRILRSGEQGPEFYRELWDTISAGRVWRGRITNRRKDGTLYQEEMSITPVEDASGNIVNYVAVKRDVTRELELEEQLHRSQKLEAVGKLTGSIAHDFNNLLTVIRSNAELLESLVRDAPAEADGYLEDLRHAAARGAGLVRKLLAFSRRERLTVRPLDLEVTTRDFVGTLRRLLPSSVEIRLRVPGEVPTVLADDGAVEQILMNLATNAADAIDGKGEIEIELGREEVDEKGEAGSRGYPVEAGEYGRISVKDEGVGMDEETLERVFDPFYSTKPMGEGTGLGMAVTYGLVKQLGGYIDVTSTPGDGTRVTVLLPTTDRRPAEAEETPARPSTKGPDVTSGGILVVDDEADVRRAARRILERLGYEVHLASDGERALATLRERADEIDLVVTDIVMPKLGGRGLHRRLREEYEDLPVLFMSGYAQEEGDEGVSLDVDVPFLPKPWTMDELAEAVANAMAGGGRGPEE